MQVPNLSQTHRTVFIKTADYPTERAFHLLVATADRFAAKVISEGGEARVAPFTVTADLEKMFAGIKRIDQ